MNGRERAASKLQLTCGLEIHQQLDTGRLFSRMPGIIKEGPPDFEVVRTLRASAGETGEVDAAALHERAKAKRFRYQGYHGVTGLVELDEEPPSPMDEEALEAALQVAKLLGSTILDTVQVMRKTVIDGSNTSGFQRTALIALGGQLKEEPVRIETLCLEEDSCKIVKRTPTEDVYNLSRLGIPLIEIATAPDITTPEQAGRVAAEIGMILRSTGKCKRGLGTIRQDLNVSIPGGTRVEIKGAQDLKLIPTLVENEALRQAGLLAVKEELARRNITTVLPPPPHDVTSVLADAKESFLTKGVARGEQLIGIALPGMAGLLGFELFPGYRLGTELAGYAKALGFGGLIHSDEEPKKYGFTESIMTKLKKKLGVKKNDAFILLLGEKEKVEEALAFSLIPRLEQLLHGVPKEVRQALPDGTTTFLRPMPGAARMYPETDIPHVTVDATRVSVPKLLKEQEAELAQQYGISAAQAHQLLREGWAFPKYAARFPKLEPKFLATTLLDTPKELRRRYKKELDLTAHEEELGTILEQVNAGAVPREAVIELLAHVADGKEPDFSKYAMLDEQEVERVVRRIVSENKGAPLNALMGLAMKELHGKAPGKRVMELLRRYTQ